MVDLLDLLEDANSMVLAVAGYVALVLLGVVGTQAGWAHITGPAGSLVGTWLGLAGLSGVVATVGELFVMLVGVLVLLAGVSMLWTAGVRLVQTLSELV